MTITFVVCSGIFWGIICASVAVGFNLRAPLKHLVTGMTLQILGFIIVGIMALVLVRESQAIRKRQSLTNANLESEFLADEW